LLPTLTAEIFFEWRTDNGGILRTFRL